MKISRVPATHALAMILASPGVGFCAQEAPVKLPELPPIESAAPAKTTPAQPLKKPNVRSAPPKLAPPKPQFANSPVITPPPGGLPPLPEPPGLATRGPDVLPKSRGDAPKLRDLSPPPEVEGAPPILPDIKPEETAPMSDLPLLPPTPPGAPGADGAAPGAEVPVEEPPDETLLLAQELESATKQLNDLGKKISVLAQKLGTLNKKRGPVTTETVTTTFLPVAPPADAGASLASLPSVPSPLPGGPPDPPLPITPATTVEVEVSPDLQKLSYQVSQFLIKYAPLDREPNSQLPPVDELTLTKVKLGATPIGYLGVGKGTKDAEVVINQLTEPTIYSGEALQAIYGGVAEELNEKGVFGVLVVPDPQDIEPATGKDLRGGRKQLSVLVYFSEVRQVRTIAKSLGSNAAAIDLPQHAWIKLGSPLKPGTDTKAGDLLNKEKLQEYLSRLNRFPGRRVDVAINAAEEPGGIVLDYLIREDKPIFGYVQGSNTGTESTGEWRLRGGFQYRSFFGRNDILDAEYVTDTDGKSKAVIGAYEMALFMPNLLKGKIYASWGQFTASDVGFDQQMFDGESTIFGGVLTTSPFQIKGYPIDIFAGAEWRDISVSNSTFPQEGTSQFFLPYVGIGTVQTNDRYSVASSVQLQMNLPDKADTKDGDDLDALGRFNADREFLIGKWNLSMSAFIEPILYGDKWKEAKDWKKAKLAQELAIATRGQYTFGDARLVPQFEEVLGGFSSVRGYPESLTAGDTVIIGTAEYKLHIPKFLKPADAIAADKPPTPGMPPPPEMPPPKFAWRPPTSGAAGGKPDWDLIFRAFIDAGQTYNNERLVSAEVNSTLLGAGIGLELQIMRYLDFRVDWGIALLEQDKFLLDPVRAGDSRFHLGLTLSW